MAPPVRRRVETPEELQAKIEALSNMGAPPSLGFPELDARSALFEMLQTREREEAPPPIAGPDEPAPRAPPPAAPPTPAPPAAPPPATAKPTLDELLKDLPALTVQKPIPPKPVYTEYQRDDDVPEPEPEPDPPQEREPPSELAARTPMYRREPTYTPPPEQPYDDTPPQEMGPPLPEPEQDAITGASRAVADYRTTPSPNTWASDSQTQAAPNTWATEDRPPPPPLPDSEAQSAREALADYARDPDAPPPPPAPVAAPKLAPGQAPPPGSGPDYAGIAGRVASTPQQGARPDYFGHDDDPGFTRDARIRQARAAYDRLPERRSQQWEQEYLARNQRMGDQEIRRRGIALGLFGGYDRMREAQTDWRQGQQRYDQGLTAAQMRDRGEGRISRAQAEALAATGQVSPEAAAEMRLNDPLLKQFGQFASQGGRAEHLDFQRDKMIQELLARTAQGEARDAAAAALQEQKDKAAKEREGIRGATQRGVAETYAKGRTQQQTKKELSPEEHANLMAAELRTKYGLSLPVADQAARGNYGNVPDAQKEDVEAHVRTMLYHPDIVSTRKYGPDVAAIPAKSGEQIKHEAAKQRATILLKPAQIKENNEITTLAADVRRAAQSWSQMPQAARDVFVQFGRDAPAALKSKGLGQYQAQAGDLQELVGGVRRRFAGLAQTNSELQGIADQMGMTAETWDPFKGSRAFEHAMERILEQTRLRKRLLNNLSKPQEP